MMHTCVCPCVYACLRVRITCGSLWWCWYCVGALIVDLCNGQGWGDLYLGPINKPGFLDEANQARELAVQEAALAQSKFRDEALAEHIRAGTEVG